MTHLCAPTFVLLAGVSLAIAVESRRARGDTERAIDRYILTRGALIVAFEVVWMSPVMLDPGRVLLQVLYAIGASLMCMALLATALRSRARGCSASRSSSAERPSRACSTRSTSSSRFRLRSS